MADAAHTTPVPATDPAEVNPAVISSPQDAQTQAKPVEEEKVDATELAPAVAASIAESSAKPTDIEPKTEATTSEPVSETKAAQSQIPDPDIQVPDAGVASVDAVPDPDEDELDDLDELDDVLDQFTASKIDSMPAPATSGPGRPAAPLNEVFGIPPESDPIAAAPTDDDDFAKMLTANMADMLGELDQSPEMAKQLEDMIRELGKATDGAINGEGSTARSTNGASSSDAGKPAESFQDTIRQTMERMQQGGEAAGAAATEAGDADFMAALLREMDSGGGASDDDFSKMLMGMMEQLTNKEILYEPMKELDSKFPDWMAKNQDKVSIEDITRYREIQRLSHEIVTKFEEPGYSDDKVEYREYIIERMQKMQNEGSPPQELVGSMEAAQEAMGNLDAGCPTQ
ncbi:Pex19-domain-containing protein [Microthyrium microscopicum]|uniref:Pex19-domain-containing protein n=1 Tax=Microthyrium microscopicum TaxID=703497 RepID=A0A6A6U126_9PEZI|nr:Pex19-domain-containing protein [Microthyrium microscopicum]